MEVNIPNTGFNLHRGRLYMEYHRAHFWGPLFLICFSYLSLNIQGSKLFLYAGDTNALVVYRKEEVRSLVY